MSYDEEQQRKSRVVVDTPTSRREVVQTETSRTPDRSGVSTGTVAALVIGALALATILFLFLRSNQSDDANANQVATTTTTTTSAATTAPTAPPPTIIQQAAPPPQQAPVIIQQPAAAPPPASAPVIVTQPAPSSATESTSSNSTRNPVASAMTDDVTVQASVSRKLADASELSTSNVTATVSGGRATLTGTVDTKDLKNRAERIVRGVRGVRNVDNQIVVSGNSNDSLTPPL